MTPLKPERKKKTTEKVRKEQASKIDDIQE